VSIFNFYSIVLLWTRAATEERHWRFRRIGVAMALKVLPMAFRKDWFNFAGSSSSAAMGAGFFMTDRKLRGWGQALSHAMLVPYAHFILRGMIF